MREENEVEKSEGESKVNETINRYLLVLLLTQYTEFIAHNSIDAKPLLIKCNF